MIGDMAEFTTVRGCRVRLVKMSRSEPGTVSELGVNGVMLSLIVDERYAEVILSTDDVKTLVRLLDA